MRSDFIKLDGPRGNWDSCQMSECIPEVVEAMRACISETGQSMLLAANITADHPAEVIARGKYVLSQSGPLRKNTAFSALMDMFQEAPPSLLLAGTFPTSSCTATGQAAVQYPAHKHRGAYRAGLHQNLARDRCQWYPYGNHELGK